MSQNTLIIGACGQVGTELVLTLRERYPEYTIVASDIRPSENDELKSTGPFELLDVLKKDDLYAIIKKYDVKIVYNLAALLSASAEKNPGFGWKLNMDGLFNTLDLAKEKHIGKLFWPSSIAAFGPTTPKQNTPQDTIMDPTTVYGITKQAGERCCEYYFNRWGVDVRSIRYPGLISYKTLPGGGTTDYAVEIYHEAIKKGNYTCFLNADTSLPMLYMPDAVKATIDITEAKSEQISIRSSYNLAGFSFNPEQLTKSIQKHIPDFTINYNPDFRQAIAEGWPQSIDDREARAHWGWKNDFEIDDMTVDMIKNLKEILSIE